MEKLERTMSSIGLWWAQDDDDDDDEGKMSLKYLRCLGYSFGDKVCYVSTYVFSI
jgi:hypothetical protein